MKTRRLALALLWGALLWGGLRGLAQEVEILSLARNGLLTFTNSSQNATCRVEWASCANGPWYASWQSLTNLVVTNQAVQVAVPMFYRVVATVPPVLTHIAAADWYALLEAHAADTNRVILDIRTPTEFAPQHLKQAVNLDYYSANFASDLAKLNRGSLYLLYCGSGSRSGKAMPVFAQLGFQRVYGLTGGFSAFKRLPGAAAYLEP